MPIFSFTRYILLELFVKADNWRQINKEAQFFLHQTNVSSKQNVKKKKIIKYVMLKNSTFNPLVPGVHWKVAQTSTDLQLSAVGLLKYVWPFSGHQVLKA